MKKYLVRFICLVKGHKSDIASCPFTGYKYDACSRCESYKIVGKAEFNNGK
jgi:hypothetical protein